MNTEGHFDAFISYSRKDKTLANQFKDYLVTHNKSPWIDENDIPLGVDFLDEIYDGIEKSENFIFLISPDSCASEICRMEIEHAIKHHKRIVPILVADTPTSQVHKKLAAINWILNKEGFEQMAKDLVEVVETDVSYIKQHTEILNDAIAWEKANKNTSLLMRGQSLKEAEAWLQSSGDKDPEPAALHSMYISASRASSSRRLRLLIGGVTLALLVSIGLGIYALLQQQVAEEQRVLAEERANIATSRQLAMQSANLETDQPQLSLLLAIEALQAYNTGDAQVALLDRLVHFKNIHRIVQEWGISGVRFITDSTFVTNTSLEGLKLWSTNGGPPLDSIPGDYESIEVGSTGAIVAFGTIDATETDTTYWALQTIDPKSFDITSTIPFSKYIHYTCFGQQDQLIAIDDGDQLYVWDTQQKVLDTIHSIREGSRKSFIGFNSKGQLVTAFTDKVYLIDPVNDSIVDEVTLSWPEHEVRTIVNELSNPLYMGVFNEDRNLALVHLDSLKIEPMKVAFVKEKFNSIKVAYFPKNNLFLEGDANGNVHLSKPGTNYLATNLKLWQNQRVADIHFSGDGKYIVVCNPGKNAMVVHAPNLIAPLTARFKFTAEREFVFIQSLFDSTLILKEVATDQIIDRFFFNGSLDNIEYYPNGIVVEQSPDYVDQKFFRTRKVGSSFELHQSLTNYFNEEAVIKVGPKGEKAFVYVFDEAGSKILILDLESEEILQEQSIASSPFLGYFKFRQGGKVITGFESEVGLIRWNLEQHTLDTLPFKISEEFIDDMVFSSSGNLLAASDNGYQEYVFDIASKKQIKMEGQSSMVTHFCFNKDESILYGGTRDGKLIVWDRYTGNMLGTPMTLYNTAFKSLTLDSATNTLVSYDLYGEPRRLILDQDQQISEGCNIVGRNLTLEEWNLYFPNTPYRPTCR